MPSIIDTLITDRTQEDVDNLISLLASGVNPSSNHKGAYNASDLNRVGEAVEYLEPHLASIGIHAEAGLKTDWTSRDIPTQSQLNQYLDTVWKLREKIMEYRPEPELPETMRHLDYNGANQIEALLQEIYSFVTRIKLSYRSYSGRQISGVNCLP